MGPLKECVCQPFYYFSYLNQSNKMLINQKNLDRVILLLQLNRHVKLLHQKYQELLVLTGYFSTQN